MCKSVFSLTTHQPKVSSKIISAFHASKKKIITITIILIIKVANIARHRYLSSSTVSHALSSANLFEHRRLDHRLLAWFVVVCNRCVIPCFVQVPLAACLLGGVVSF